MKNKTNNSKQQNETNVSRETVTVNDILDERIKKHEEQTQKKERNESQTYAIKSFKQLVTKLERMKMTTPDETEKLKEICKTVIQRWISIGIEF